MKKALCPFCDVQMLAWTKKSKYVCQVCGREYSFEEIDERSKNLIGSKQNRVSKYNARKTENDGIMFDSKKESLMYDELKLMEKQGLIKNLKLQPEFTLLTGYKHPKTGRKIRPIKYRADFQFFDIEEGRKRVIDCKGFKTKVYNLKKKMFNKKFGRRGIYLEERI